MRGFLIWGVCLLGVISGCASTVTGTHKEAPRTLTDRDLVMVWSHQANQSTPNFSESLICRARLDGGGEIYIRLLVTNIVGADGRAELKARVQFPRGPAFHMKRRWKREEWSAGEAHFLAELGANRLDVKVGQASMRIKDEHFEVELHIESTHPALMPRGGQAHAGPASFYQTLIPIPRGKLKGIIRFTESSEDAARSEEPRDETSGQRTISFTGVAYVEHRASNMAPYAMARRFFNLMDIGTERTILMSAFEGTRQIGARNQGWLYYATDDDLLVEDELRIRVSEEVPDEQTGYPIPAVIMLEGRAGSGAFSGTIKAERFIKRIDDLSSLSKVERFVVERFFQPWTFRYDASFLLKVGATRTLRGTGRYQVQHLK